KVTLSARVSIQIRGGSSPGLVSPVRNPSRSRHRTRPLPARQESVVFVVSTAVVLRPRPRAPSFVPNPPCAPYPPARISTPLVRPVLHTAGGYRVRSHAPRRRPPRHTRRADGLQDAPARGPVAPRQSR